MGIRTHINVEAGFITALHLYVLKKISEKANLRKEVKLSDALTIISVLFHIPKTSFRARKRGLNICAFDILKELEKAGYIKIHPFNKVVILNGVEHDI